MSRRRAALIATAIIAGGAGLLAAGIWMIETSVVVFKVSLAVAFAAILWAAFYFNLREGWRDP